MSEASTGLDQAEMLVTAKRYDDALEILSRMPEDAGARYLSAVAYLCKEDLVPALREVERAIGMAPDEPDPYMLRSDVLHEMGRNKDSLDSAREAVRLAPDQARFQHTLARSALEAHHWKVAEAAAREAVRLEPDWAEAHNVLALVALGRRRRKEARAHLEHALERDPNNPLVLNNLAVAMPRLRPRTESVKLLEEAVRLDPSNKQLVDNLYVEASQHVRGGGFDRLDVFLGGPAILIGLLMVSVLNGWIQLPRLLSTGVVVVAIGLIVAYAVGDFLRNRGRLRGVRSGTRVLFFQWFQRDLWLGVLFFVLTLFVPAVALGALATSVGVPLVLVSGIIVGLAMLWIRLAPLYWRLHLKPRLVRRR